MELNEIKNPLFVFKGFLTNAFIAIIFFVLGFGVLGPMLISAKSSIAVLIGFGVVILSGILTISFAIRAFNAGIRQLNKKETA